MIYNCIIIDDENHCIISLEKYITSIPELNLVTTFSDPLEALLQVPLLNKIDIIFLDINMPGISGLELSKELKHYTKKIVFTTGHTKYAYEAYESQADAYLLKPFSLMKFVTTINKLLASNQLDCDEAKDEYFFVKSKEDNLKLIKIKYEDIIAVESKLNYTLISTAERKVLTYISLKEISAKFIHYPDLIQFQRSFIVGTRHIESIDGNNIRMINGIQISVGEIYLKNFLIYVNSKLLKGLK